MPAPCNATVPDKYLSGDLGYGLLWIGQPAISDYFWLTYGFKTNKSYWSSGFGYEAVTDTDLPLARTYNALALLGYSAVNWAADDYGQPILNWARRYVRENVSDLRSLCGTGTLYAKSFYGALGVGAHLDLYRPMWYEQQVPTRASTFVHEARHLGGSRHNAVFPAGSAFGAGLSGADSNWEYNGAWRYEAAYLWDYYLNAVGTTSAMRQLARQWGNVMLAGAFATAPPYVIV
ncbi:hypothetical protein [Streptomyces sp. NPDC001717]|uniref:hypothetical protein n=1 Tax=Streptomyces sp. NPDC001717 TaxID=3364604 RepID=UPI0036C4A117